MIVACPDCATVQRLPTIRGGGSLECWRCRNTLERTSGRSIDAALACATVTFLLLFPANALPLMRVTVLGAVRESVLGSGVAMLWDQNWILMGIVVALQGILFPFLRFGLLAAALAAIRLGRQGRWTGPVFRWAEWLDLWAMPDVFLFGAIVGYSRIISFLPVAIEPGGWCLVGAALFSMLTRATMDGLAIWRPIAAPAPPEDGPLIACTSCDLVVSRAEEGGRCPRCLARLHVRRRASVQMAAALVAAAYLLYPVANYYPMSVDYQINMAQPHTIASGVRELIDAHLWPLAAIIFTVSIAIPLLKLVGLTWCMISAHRRSRRFLIRKTRLYRVIDEIGRWSNVDIFTIVTFLPLMQFGQVINVQASRGAPAFLAVVVLTMIASRIFDPRLMWDALDTPAPDGLRTPTQDGLRTPAPDGLRPMESP